MYPELTNLLPPDHARILRREYFIRLLTVAIFALTAVVIGSGALLVPSYLYLNQKIAQEQAQVKDLDTILAGSQGQQATDRLKGLSGDISYLARLATSSSATAVVRSVLAVPVSGIVLTGFSYTPAQGSVSGKMSLTGTASTRETLRSYVDALGTLPFVSGADLPISAYAKETNIPFMITLTGTLSP